jgi:hypothetical protein
VGKLDKVLLIKVNLPHFDKYSLFQPPNCLTIFSTVPFHIEVDLYGTPKGRFKYFTGNKATLHPIILAKLSTSSTSPIGMIFDFNKLIFNLDTTSTQKETSQITKIFSISLAKN